MPKNLGFTLIELLVSIAIIGIVFGVIITSSVGIQRSARDTQRQSDLKTIQAALQYYYADLGYFPSPVYTFPASGTFTNCDGIDPTVPSCTADRTYISKIPSDPVSTNPAYCYKAFTKNDLVTACDNNLSGVGRCQYYVLCAKLEGQYSQDSDCNNVCGNSSFNLKLSPL
ncbi:prepilin-type N-terminal cleavage/methylation domain-containing protein [Candidatus Daviesbacteria bacterium]|nr:prepilin-type N-terminal cleavage/methylation domain-containing protein [Candidatus Daviesbacteria bacterium]